MVFSRVVAPLLTASLLAASSFGQSEASATYRAPQHPGYTEGRPLSGVGAWRYDQARRGYYQAVARWNGVAAETSLAQLADLRSERRDRLAVDKEGRREASKAAKQRREQWQSDRAQELWRDITTGYVDWPLALRHPWSQARLNEAITALQRGSEPKVATAALYRLRRAIRHSDDRFTHLQKIQALRVLDRLELIAAIPSDFDLASRTTSRTPRPDVARTDPARSAPVAAVASARTDIGIGPRAVAER
ncbi:hypothetical protein [Botrimarina sp.]|uniref:hypothetical protein n=1 Tax=Botrimarina sp. TaxID=2795802 RepID=UPI0032EC0C40